MPAGSVSGSSHPGPEESPESRSFFRDATLVLDSPARYPPVPPVPLADRDSRRLPLFCPALSPFLQTRLIQSTPVCRRACRYESAISRLVDSREVDLGHIFVLMDASWSVLSGLDVRSIFINFAPFPVSRQVCSRRRREKKTRIKEENTRQTRDAD